MKEEAKPTKPVPECFHRTCTREFTINRALSIRADGITGFYTIYDLSVKYNLKPDTVQRILLGVRVKVAALKDGYGSIKPANNSVKTLVSVVKLLHLVGLSYNKIALYLGASRQYTARLGHKNDSKRRPIVPVLLATSIKTKNRKNIGPGTYYIQYAETADWVLLYETPEQMPHFVSTEEIKGAASIIQGAGVFLPKLQ